MNFNGIIAITIPEGVVKKIMRGDECLWEAIGEPTVFIEKYEIKIFYDPNLNHYIYDTQLNANIQGISSSKIQSAEMVFYKNTGYDNYEEKANINIDYTSSGYTHIISTSFSQEETYTSIKIRIKYMDKDGTIQTLYSPIKNASIIDGIIL